MPLIGGAWAYPGRFNGYFRSTSCAGYSSVPVSRALRVLHRLSINRTAGLARQQNVLSLRACIPLHDKNHGKATAKSRSSHELASHSDVYRAGA